ncbi:MAG TPA: asparagine synthase (glutamine-hydrolyzing) [Chthoniobacterales bacterium]|nr:asparagine synthase (glutamine-hydrolyzing) [Chthoniobacterales bacterium]
MCGIAAIFAHGVDAPPVDRDELIAIRDRMIQRGPDGDGLWISEDRRVGLAHRRLTIVDLTDAGLQPMWNSDRTVCVTYNGEIYNYPELRAQLSARGCQFVSNCDTEVLLHLYAEKGEKMVEDLRGMYAFTIWDARKRVLFSARDPFGIKPLYYSDDGRTIRVASQVKALLAGKQVDTSPEAAGHVAFFLWGTVPDPFTLYRGVRGLPAGHTLTIREGGSPEIRRFCFIPDILREAELAAKALPHQARNHAEILRAALCDSAEHHLMADVPVGVFLSAGLDSSTIAGLVSERHHDVRTVTLGFHEYRGTEQDETALAEVVARTYRTNHQTIWITRRDFETDAVRLFEAMDGPSIDGVNTYFVSLATKRAGLKVALSGLGGDELFGGYPSFRDVPRIVRMCKPFSLHLPAFGRGFRIITASALKHFTSPKYAGILEYGSTYPGAYLLRRSLFMPWELPEILDPDLVREGWGRLNTLGDLATLCDSLQSGRLRVSALELCWYMRHQLLRDSDWAGMAHSLEIRVPLVDVKLLREIAPLLAASRPPEKRDMALTPSTPLPDAVLSRPKTGFTVPVRDWLLRSFDPLSAGERGLRGWARYVHGEFAEASGAASSVLRRKHLGRSRRSGQTGNPRIVVYRIGQLGDTIVALPAMWAIRENFPGAKLTLLCDQHPHTNYILASGLLRDAGIFDDFMAYPVGEPGSGATGRATELLKKLRERKFDTVVYLAPSARSPARVRRDKWFFRAAGIRTLIGMNGFPKFEARASNRPLDAVPRESELLLLRLRESGLRVSLQHPRSELGLDEKNQNEVDAWVAAQSQHDGDRRWIAVGPGSKMPAKQWPLENYDAVVRDLIGAFDVWPIVFGGPEDREIGDGLIERWGRGYNAAGPLGVRAAAAALRRCRLYLGNDTGTMHLAAAAGVRCVAIFSSRERPGLWYPAGTGNRVFRSEIDCEGCDLKVCVTRNIECLRRIAPQTVFTACAELLAAPATPPDTAAPPAARPLPSLAV